MYQYVQVADVDGRIRFGCISKVKYLTRNEIEKGDENAHGFQCEKVFNGDRGRPRYNITKQHLVYFLNFGFTATGTFAMLGVSEPTIRRRLQEFGLSSRNFTTISDEALDGIVAEIKEDFYKILAKKLNLAKECRLYKINKKRAKEFCRLLQNTAHLENQPLLTKIDL